MYSTVSEVLGAIKKDKFKGIVVYKGPSQIDGKPIVAIFNRIVTDSDNTKTGAMVQSWIMRSDIKPMDALKTGADSSVCGECPLRPINKVKLKAEGKKPCYVKVWQAPRSVYEAYKNGRYLRAGIDFPYSIMPAIFQGLAVRFGSYGDPYAVPLRFLMPIAKAAKTFTGYSHQWNRPDSLPYAAITMASVDNAIDMKAAHNKGWRTFRTRNLLEPTTKTEFICPASKEAGVRTNCAACSLCAGTTKQAKSVVIAYH
jgi:hypothetical protein|tara:strand:+ start:171 stop:938 length:768 start_codon:yes stop_codon:yes gene_type:complete